DGGQEDAGAHDEGRIDPHVDECRFEGDLLGAVLKLDLRDQADARSDGREDEDVEPAEFHRKAIRYPVLDEIVRVAFYVAADGRARQCADERASVKRIL